MARRYYRRNKFKLKLRKNTIYSIFAFFLILTGVLFFLSFTKSGESAIAINNILDKNFGFLSILAPFVFILLGFLFLKLRNFLSKPNLAIGFLLFFISLSGLFKAGEVGIYLYQILSDVLTGLGANLVYLCGILIGVIVFFDTSIDEILAFFAQVKKKTTRLFPSFVFSFFKTQKSPIFKKPMTIKGMERESVFPKASTAPIISDTSAFNTLGKKE